MVGLTNFVLSGASGGIGRNLIPHLLNQDVVIGLYRNNKPDFPSSVDLILHKIDLLDSSQVKAFSDQWGDRLDKIVLIHGAVQNTDGLAVNFQESDWDTVLDVNLKGDFLLTKALLPFMVKKRWGRIIHISSHVGVEGVPGTVAYAASKAGLLGMSRVLAKEYARFGITSNVLKLGYFDLGLMDQLSEKMRNEVISRIPNKKFGTIENIVHAIRFLIQADYVNGSVISIDGGL